MDELTVLAEHCNRTERRAEAAERELVKIKLLTFLEKHIGKAFHAVIISVEDFGFFCRLAELPAEGLVHVTSLGDDFFYLEQGTHTLIGRRSGRRYRLGDRVEVKLVRVDIDRRELDLILAETATAKPDQTEEEDAILASARVNRPRPARPAPAPSQTESKRTLAPRKMQVNRRRGKNEKAELSTDHFQEAATHRSQ